MMVLLIKLIFVVSCFWFLVSAKPAQLGGQFQAVEGISATQLTYIATHSCLVGHDSVHVCQPSLGVQGTRKLLQFLTSDERAKLDTLHDGLESLKVLLDAIAKQGVLHNAMSDAMYERSIDEEKESLHLHPQWQNANHLPLTLQQESRIKALVRMAGYVSCLEKQKPSDRDLFYTDVSRLQCVLTKLRQITCTLHDLLDGVDVQTQVMNSHLPDSFCRLEKGFRPDEIMMGLTILDIRQFLQKINVSL